MAAQRKPNRQREQIRRKPLVVDTSTTLDLGNVKPHLPLKTRGKALWRHFEAETPVWWNGSDIPMAATLCAVTDVMWATLDDAEASAAGKAALIREWRALAGELGMSPTARGRLKMKEAQSTIAAKKVEQLDSDSKRKRDSALDIDELMDDG